ncbi:discoidin domain-containing protein [Pedobacter arcticus]|uniref:discoidin domain-containing protein n=1 Tax=Pedobacter arcticus TaxID=752140 RepID=UPI0003735735|nr:discoidin domain-containing protein [Pedobacter arcticus]
MKKILYAFALCALVACGKKDILPTPTPAPPTPEPPVNTLSRVSGPSSGTFSSDRQYNLNLVYFVPADVNPINDYQKRLSELMLWTRDWYKTQMGLNGYGSQTFGLFMNSAKTRVRITTIYGTKNKYEYPYNGGQNPMMAEINSYFATHPAEKTSDHTLVIIPRYSIGSNGTPSGGPFFGLGKWCFALDYEGMNITNLGKTNAEGNLFSVWFGGLVHELGHGLNLPHDRQKVSENTDPNKGMSLMWAGNGTLGISPTFLTATDAAILHVNQIFNTGTNSYYGAVTGGITKIKAEYVVAKNAIVLSGKFTSSDDITSIVYYNDPNYNNEGTGANRDYNAITWESKPIGTDGFYVEIPINELVYTDNATPYELRVKLVHKNGNVTETVYNYSFSNNIPVLNFSTREELSKTNWQVTSFSSEETSGEGSVNGKASTLIDGNASTYWHSRWSSNTASYPHYIVVDMAASQTATGVALAQRGGLQRAIKDFDVLTSTDGVNFSMAGTFVAANSNGSQYFDFTAPKTFRYFKIIAKNAWDGLEFAALSEVGMY